MTTEVVPTIDRQRNVLDPSVIHFMGWEEGKALCGISCNRSKPPKKLPSSAIDCVVCAGIWESLSPERRRAHNMFWSV